MGWLAEPGSEPGAEDVAAEIERISATEPFSVPTSIVDEVLGVCPRLGISPLAGCGKTLPSPDTDLWTRSLRCESSP